MHGRDGVVHLRAKQRHRKGLFVNVRAACMDLVRRNRTQVRTERRFKISRQSHSSLQNGYLSLLSRILDKRQVSSGQRKFRAAAVTCLTIQKVVVFGGT